MERINGYLVLPFLKQDYNELIKSGKIEVIKDYKKCFWINNFNGKRLLFKEEAKERIYHELIVSEIAKLFKIETPDYDIAIFENIIGNICHDFKEPGYTYTDGNLILSKYCEGLNDHGQSLNYYTLNNLEGIWQALEYHFEGFKDKYNIVKNIMEELVKRFICDALTQQIDRSGYNYIIKENKNTGLLAPYFDSSLSFVFGGKMSLSVDEGSFKRNFYDNISIFLTHSDSYYIEMFNDMYRQLTPNKLLEIFRVIENKINYQIPEKIKSKMYNEYFLHYNLIGECISKPKRSR